MSSGSRFDMTEDQPTTAQQSSCFTGTTGLVALLGGAGVGAALMYLLDPNEGQHRRQNVTRLAGNAIHTAGDALGGAWESVRHGAHYAADAASHLGDSTSYAAHDAADRIGSSRMAQRIGRGARGFNAEASDRFNYLLHGRQTHGIQSALGQGLCAVGCLALGFTAMYYFDPADGARRRTVCRDKCLSAFGRMATSLERTGRHLRNRLFGAVAQVRSSASRAVVDDRVLHERVRAQLGRIVANPGAIEVTARDGRVTLCGPILASEVDGLLKAVWSVRGTCELINQLSVFSHEDDLHREVSRAGAAQPTTL
jgi:hypothetical protein